MSNIRQINKARKAVEGSEYAPQFTAHLKDRVRLVSNFHRLIQRPPVDVPESIVRLCDPTALEKEISEILKVYNDKTLTSEAKGLCFKEKALRVELFTKMPDPEKILQGIHEQNGTFFQAKVAKYGEFDYPTKPAKGSEQPASTPPKYSNRVVYAVAADRGVPLVAGSMSAGPNIAALNQLLYKPSVASNNTNIYLPPYKFGSVNLFQYNDDPDENGSELVNQMKEIVATRKHTWVSTWRTEYVARLCEEDTKGYSEEDNNFVAAINKLPAEDIMTVSMCQTWENYASDLWKANFSIPSTHSQVMIVGVILRPTDTYAIDVAKKTLISYLTGFYERMIPLYERKFVCLDYFIETATEKDSVMAAYRMHPDVRSRIWMHLETAAGYRADIECDQSVLSQIKIQTKDQLLRVMQVVWMIEQHFCSDQKWATDKNSLTTEDFKKLYEKLFGKKISTNNRLLEEYEVFTVLVILQSRVFCRDSIDFYENTLVQLSIYGKTKLVREYIRYPSKRVTLIPIEFGKVHAGDEKDPKKDTRLLSRAVTFGGLNGTNVGGAVRDVVLAHFGVDIDGDRLNTIARLPGFLFAEESAGVAMSTICCNISKLTHTEVIEALVQLFWNFADTLPIRKDESLLSAFTSKFGKEYDSSQFTFDGDHRITNILSETQMLVVLVVGQSRSYRGLLRYGDTNIASRYPCEKSFWEALWTCIEASLKNCKVADNVIIKTGSTESKDETLLTLFDVSVNNPATIDLTAAHGSDEVVYPAWIPASKMGGLTGAYSYADWDTVPSHPVFKAVQRVIQTIFPEFDVNDPHSTVFDDEQAKVRFL